MIIRMTVQDNDFTRVVEKYASQFWSNITQIEDLTVENSVRIKKRHEQINRLLNPNINEIFTKENTDFIEEQVKLSFAYFCKKNYRADANYLISNFQVSCRKMVKDKWENCETVYWFQHSASYITQ